MKLFRTPTITAIQTALAALAMPVVAQSNRIPISIMYSGKDDVGKSFNYALKEQLRAQMRSNFPATSTAPGTDRDHLLHR